ncbi:MAG: OmpA family protein [Geminicoccaceae bacterium]
MRSITKPIAAALLLAVVGACSAIPVDTTESIGKTVEEQAFNDALRTGYLDLSSSWPNTGENHYYFREKAKRSMLGYEDVFPDRVGSRSIAPEELRIEALGHRARLVGNIKDGSATRLPVETAEAQVAFDCWLAAIEANPESDRAAECKARMLAALDALDGGLVPEQFVVFFNFDSTGLSPEAEMTLDAAAASIAADQPVQVIVAGHTDTAGPTSYNQGLSERRAAVVTDALVSRGVDGAIIEPIGFGESALAEETPDNTPNPVNRRAEVIFE